MNKKSLEAIEISRWDETISNEVQKRAVEALERGKILYFPHLAFSLTSQEADFLNPQIVDPKSKNISYDLKKDALGGALCSTEESDRLKAFIKRYATCSRNFLNALIPHYSSTIIQAKTSLRPVEIQGRKSSYRKDDTRLHVDAFPSMPVKGQRILRFFTNVNPNGKPRCWRAGEPFEDVVTKIAPRVSSPLPGINYFMKWCGLTKDLRTPYDHYMLQIHDEMKRDMDYQRTVPQEELEFPPTAAGRSLQIKFLMRRCRVNMYLSKPTTYHLVGSKILVLPP